MEPPPYFEAFYSEAPISYRDVLAFLAQGSPNDQLQKAQEKIESNKSAISTRNGIF